MWITSRQGRGREGGGGRKSWNEMERNVGRERGRRIRGGKGNGWRREGEQGRVLGGGVQDNGRWGKGRDRQRKRLKEGRGHRKQTNAQEGKERPNGVGEE